MGKNHGYVLCLSNMCDANSSHTTMQGCIRQDAACGEISNKWEGLYELMWSKYCGVSHQSSREATPSKRAVYYTCQWEIIEVEDT